MKKNTTIALLATIILPVVSFAALDGVTELLQLALKIINLFIPIIFGISIIIFFWGMAQFILKDAGNEKTRADGKKKMLWSIIALFVMASLFGILNFIGVSIGINPNMSGGAGNGSLDSGGPCDAKGDLCY